MEQIEEAGIHSGDSSCVMPTQSISVEALEKIRLLSETIVKGLAVKGFCNIQMIVKNNEPLVIEVNSRASRTIPFVSKAVGLPLAKISALIQAGEAVLDGLTKPTQSHVAVKTPVFPFNRFPEIDPALSPEMKSTGEVMAFGKSFAEAYLKSLKAAGQEFGGKALVTDCGRNTANVVQALKNAGVEVIEANGKDAAAQIEACGFAVSIPQKNDENSFFRRQCIARKKTLVTSAFAAMAVAQCLKQNPGLQVISLNCASAKLAYA
jgi:carbamoyl-phosphate synthase large subunit